MVKCTIHSPPRQCLTRDHEMETTHRDGNRCLEETEWNGQLPGRFSSWKFQNRLGDRLVVISIPPSGVAWFTP